MNLIQPWVTPLVMTFLIHSQVVGEDSQISKLEQMGAKVTIGHGTHKGVQVSFRGKVVSKEFFLELERLGDIVSLDLKCSGVDDDMIQSIVRFKTLRSLNLSSNHVGDAGIAHLKKLTQLTELNLEFNVKLSDTGFECLRDMPWLQVLNVEATKISDKGTSFLDQLVRLKSLHIGHTHITDKALLRCQKMSDLRVLDLTNTKIGDEGVKSLQRSCQFCARSITELDNGGGLPDTRRVEAVL